MAAYIAFEGGEATGKTTQAERLANRLGALLTREPGGTTLGKGLRALLLDPADKALCPKAEALLMAADRSQHIEELVLPSLMAGRHVVSDRSVYSSLAYQGYGRQLGLDDIRWINQWATGGCWPDIVVLLELREDIAAQRLGGVLDRIEQAGEDFHDRVNQGFRALAAAEPGRWLLVDCSGSADEVEARLWEALKPRLTGLGLTFE